MMEDLNVVIAGAAREGGRKDPYRHTVPHHAAQAFYGSVPERDRRSALCGGSTGFSGENNRLPVRLESGLNGAINSVSAV